MDNGYSRDSGDHRFALRVEASGCVDGNVRHDRWGEAGSCKVRRAIGNFTLIAGGGSGAHTAQ